MEKMECMSVNDAEESPTVDCATVNESIFATKAQAMMSKWGYIHGSGLGKNQQGIVAPIELKTQFSAKGLGTNRQYDTGETWDYSQEEIHIREPLEWFKSITDLNLDNNELDEWIKEGERIQKIDKENHFCDSTILDNVLKAKEIFNELDLKELNLARSRANPFETIRSVFFLNRAALKMANIDAATDFMFTNIDENIYHKGDNPGPYYFADVCAGPGGFTEYVLWRKKWLFKGFGLTLRDENDFRLNDTICCSPATFQAFYGSRGDGDVCCPENIEDFREKILFETGGNGVHFMVSDGGFCVDGNENLQEVLSKNIYICQCLVALEILRNHGHFVTKLFDIFTCFSVGLIFLMSKCFEKICILKPNSSRPANSERYLICYNFQRSANTARIRQYLRKIVTKLWNSRNTNNSLDIIEIVPLEILKDDEQFSNYIRKLNGKLAELQTIHLKKLTCFCRNPTLEDPRQDSLRRQCLEYWRIPDLMRTQLLKTNLDDIPVYIAGYEDLLLLQPLELTKFDNLNNIIHDLNDWHYVLLQSTKRTSRCNFYICLNQSKVYRLQNNKWVKVKNLRLIDGTIFYGELVKENQINSKGIANKYSLHIIDALRLGDSDLTKYKLHERLKLIRIYCCTVNRELSLNTLRIRPKILQPLDTIMKKPMILSKPLENGYYSLLPTIGYDSQQEMFDVNSILLLKTSEKQSFHSTYILKLHLFINESEQQERPLEQLFNFIKTRLI